MCEIDYEKMSEQEAKDYFNKNYNIGYVDESLPTPSNELLFKHYVASAFVYSIALMIALFNPFYVEVFKGHPLIKQSMVYVYFAYLCLAPVFLWIFKPKTVYISHSVEIVNYLLKLIKREGLKKGATSTEFLKWLEPNYRQKQSFILYFIKFYFGPQMLVWSFGHWSGFYAKLQDFIAYNTHLLKTYSISDILTLPKYILIERNQIFLIILSFAYFIDTIVFTFGYLTELTILRNRIRTVESTITGLFFCLICYPYLSSITAILARWDHNESNYSGLSSDPLHWTIWLAMFLGLASLFIYVSASVALFTKASNLTNRGTVKVFPYNIIRHPAYSAKIMMWIIGSLATIKILCQKALYTEVIFYIMGAVTWSFIYYMRAITEERHLSLDPDYRAYCKQVKYKFIPKVW